MKTKKTVVWALIAVALAVAFAGGIKLYHAWSDRKASNFTKVKYRA